MALKMDGQTVSEFYFGPKTDYANTEVFQVKTNNQDGNMVSAWCKPFRVRFDGVEEPYFHDTVELSYIPAVPERTNFDYISTNALSFTAGEYKMAIKVNFDLSNNSYSFWVLYHVSEINIDEIRTVSGKETGHIYLADKYGRVVISAHSTDVTFNDINENRWTAEIDEMSYTGIKVQINSEVDVGFFIYHDVLDGSDKVNYRSCLINNPYYIPGEGGGYPLEYELEAESYTGNKIALSSGAVGGLNRCSFTIYLCHVNDKWFGDTAKTPFVVKRISSEEPTAQTDIQINNEDTVYYLDELFPLFNGQLTTVDTFVPLADNLKINKKLHNDFYPCEVIGTNCKDLIFSLDGLILQVNNPNVCGVLMSASVTIHYNNNSENFFVPLQFIDFEQTIRLLDVDVRGTYTKVEIHFNCFYLSTGNCIRLNIEDIIENSGGGEETTTVVKV